MTLTAILHQAAVFAAIALPVASIAWTVTKEEIFRELRDGADKWGKAPGRFAFLRRKVAYLVTCYYCFGHWVAIPFVYFFDLKWMTEQWFGYVAAWFALAWIAQFWLTAFNIGRAVLRGTQAWANGREALAKAAAQTAEPDAVPAFVQSMAS